MKLSYLFIVFFTIPFALCAQAKDNQTKRNNILFIIADDWGKHAKSYGTGGWINMPTFDRVASEGILFNNCFTSNPKCAPCRASITTGRNTWQLKEGIQHFGPWPKEFVTYPDILEENGYYVGYTGKGWGPGDYKSAGRKNNPAGKAYNKFKTTAPAKYIHTNDYSRNFIEHFMKNRPKGKPFCFWIGFFEPHRPYEDGVGERNGKSLKSVEVPKYYPNHDIVRGDMLDYAYEVEYMDSHVKKVLDYLKDIGELDNTSAYIHSPLFKINIFPLQPGNLATSGTRINSGGNNGVNVDGLKLSHLENFGNLFVAESLNLRSYDSEILSDDRKVLSELRAQRVKELLPGTLHPLSVLRRLLSRRDLPASLKATEMIDTDDIKKEEVLAEAAYPPLKACPLMLLPSVERVAQELAGGAESFWWHA